MRSLSKSKILSYRQCPKRLWLEVHRPDLCEDAAANQRYYQIGNQVGEIAQRLYDPKGKGVLIDREREGLSAAFAKSAKFLNSAQPIFEAGFAANGAHAFADVMLPTRKRGRLGWRMIEVKAATQVKDYHLEDTAVQTFVARSAGVPLESIALAHIDSTWVYPGREDYRGLLVEKDLTGEAFNRGEEVKEWIAAAQAVVRKRSEPKIGTGGQCNAPYPCGFLDYCQSQEPQAEYPVTWLPRVQAKALKALIDDEGVADMRNIPNEFLNDQQQRVKTHTLSGKAYFDAQGAAQDLAPHKLPVYFLDFETIQFAVPIWPSTRPYQTIPFQFSVHRLSRTGQLVQEAFLDLSGRDPSKTLAEALISACGERGPIFAYNASFETSCIKELAKRFPTMKCPLLAINQRIVDLLKVAKERYYHPDQQGSWSIKKLLPVVVPDLSYEDLDGVQGGEMAMNAYLEAIAPNTTSSRKEQIKRELLEYCALDTYAMVRLWRFFSGRNDLRL